jgi:hypothetical protein
MRFLYGAGRLLSVATVVLVASTDVRAQVVPDDFVITLRRTTCFGTCPAYIVSIDSSGRVTYDGSQFVRVAGRQEARIPLSRVAALVETVARTGFFELKDSYTADVTDLPTTIVTVRSSGRMKRVEDYVGAPAALRALERQIDESARRWVRIDVPALEELVRKGATPPRDQLDSMLLRAIQYDELDVAEALIDLGASPHGAIGPSGRRPLLESAQSAAAVKLLIDAGADPLASLPPPIGMSMLQLAVYRAPEVADALLKAGVPATQAALYEAACRGNVGVVAVLLRAGADPSVGVDGKSPADCARGSKAFPEQFAPGDRPYKVDYDSTIVALERDVADRKQH